MNIYTCYLYNSLLAITDSFLRTIIDNLTITDNCIRILVERNKKIQSWKISCAYLYQVFCGKVHQESTWGKCSELEHDCGDVGVPANGAADHRIAFSIKLNCPLTIFHLRTEERYFTWIRQCLLGLSVFSMSNYLLRGNCKLL